MADTANVRRLMDHAADLLVQALAVEHRSTYPSCVVVAAVANGIATLRLVASFMTDEPDAEQDGQPEPEVRQTGESTWEGTWTMTLG